MTRLDRLARSTRDLLNILDQISKAGAKFKSLADAWADTSTMHGELMVTILAGLATFERHLIRARTDEGRKRAQARGVRFGRPLKLTRYQIAEALARRRRRTPDGHWSQLRRRPFNDIEALKLVRAPGLEAPGALWSTGPAPRSPLDFTRILHRVGRLLCCSGNRLELSASIEQATLGSQFLVLWSANDREGDGD